jgi:hypothetical protein
MSIARSRVQGRRRAVMAFAEEMGVIVMPSARRRSQRPAAAPRADRFPAPHRAPGRDIPIHLGDGLTVKAFLERVSPGAARGRFYTNLPRWAAPPRRQAIRPVRRGAWRFSPSAWPLPTSGAVRLLRPGPATRTGGSARAHQGLRPSRPSLRPDHGQRPRPGGAGGDCWPSTPPWTWPARLGELFDRYGPPTVIRFNWARGLRDQMGGRPHHPVRRLHGRGLRDDDGRGPPAPIRVRRLCGATPPVRRARAPVRADQHDALRGGLGRLQPEVARRAGRVGNDGCYRPIHRRPARHV